MDSGNSGSPSAAGPVRVTERELMDWLEAHRPAVAVAVNYCCTDDEMRSTLNSVTGLAVLPQDDPETAYALWLKALQH